MSPLRKLIFHKYDKINRFKYISKEKPTSKLNNVSYYNNSRMFHAYASMIPSSRDIK